MRTCRGDGRRARAVLSWITLKSRGSAPSLGVAVIPCSIRYLLFRLNAQLRTHCHDQVSGEVVLHARRHRLPCVQDEVRNDWRPRLLGPGAALLHTAFQCNIRSISIAVHGRAHGQHCNLRSGSRREPVPWLCRVQRCGIMNHVKTCRFGDPLRAPCLMPPCKQLALFNSLLSCVCCCTQCNIRGIYAALLTLRS